MQAILNNAMYIFLGILIGAPAGWSLRSMLYAKQARDIALDLKKTLDERGWYTHMLSLAVVLLFTATAAIWTGVVNVQFKESKNCTEQTISQLVVALQDRTSLSTDLSIADSEQNSAFRHLIQELLKKPQQPANKMRVDFQDYLAKLDAYLNLLESQREIQRESRLPKEIDYQRCLDGN